MCIITVVVFAIERTTVLVLKRQESRERVREQKERAFIWGRRFRRDTLVHALILEGALDVQAQTHTTTR